MRENPHPDQDPNDLLYAGDNFVRKSGDAQVVGDIDHFVMTAHTKGNDDINLLSNPSQVIIATTFLIPMNQPVAF
jgi:hypothetical protein